MKQGEYPEHSNDMPHYAKEAKRLGMSLADYLKLMQQEYLEQERMTSKDDTAGQMKDMPFYHDEPKQSIQRMPR